MIIFGSILKNSSNYKIKEMIRNSFDYLFELILNPNKTNNLKEIIFCLISKIIKYHSDVIEENQNNNLLEKLITLNIEALKSNNIKFMISNLKIISNLYYYLNSNKNQEHTSNELSHFTQNVLQIIYEICFDKNRIDSLNNNNINNNNQDDNQHLIYEAFSTMGKIIEFSYTNTKLIIRDLFERLFEDFKSFINNSSYSKNLKKIFFGCICENFDCAISSGNILINLEISKNLSAVIIESFKELSDVYEEGVYVFVGISNILNEDFEIIFKEYLGPYLIHCLKSEDLSLRKVGFICLESIISNLSCKFEPYIEEFFKIIYFYLNVKIFYLMLILFY